MAQLALCALVSLLLCGCATPQPGLLGTWRLDMEKTLNSLAGQTNIPAATRERIAEYIPRLQQTVTFSPTEQTIVIGSGKYQQTLVQPYTIVAADSTTATIEIQGVPHKDGEPEAYRCTLHFEGNRFWVTVRFSPGGGPLYEYREYYARQHR